MGHPHSNRGQLIMRELDRAPGPPFGLKNNRWAQFRRISLECDLEDDLDNLVARYCSHGRSKEATAIFEKFIRDDHEVHVDKTELLFRLCCVEHLIERDRLTKKLSPSESPASVLDSIARILIHFDLLFSRLLKDVDSIYIDKIDDSMVARMWKNVRDPGQGEESRQITLETLTECALGAFRQSVKNCRSEYRYQSTVINDDRNAKDCQPELNGRNQESASQEVEAVRNEAIAGHGNTTWFDLTDFSHPPLGDEFFRNPSPEVEDDVAPLKNAGLLPDGLVTEVFLGAMNGITGKPHRQYLVKEILYPDMKIGEIHRRFFPDVRRGAIGSWKSRARKALVCEILTITKALRAKLADNEGYEEAIAVLNRIRRSAESEVKIGRQRSKMMARKTRRRREKMERTTKPSACFEDQPK